MMGESYQKGRRVWAYAVSAGGILIVCVFVFLGYLIGFFPNTVMQDYDVSPDGRTRITVILEVYGTFGPMNYVVRMGPDNGFLNWILRKKVIELDAGNINMPAPTVRWIDDRSVAVDLPVKPEKLAVMLREGLYPNPAADHYGDIHITYRPLQTQMINGKALGPLGPLKAR
jgi:hypothetical protein